MKKTQSNIQNLASVSIDTLRIVAKHLGFDQLPNRWGPNFVYGDDLTQATVKRVLKQAKEWGYTSVDMTNPDWPRPVKS